ncbi:hypothetical protein [Dysgonomonas sp. ZJ279]|uniref:hypothetical protein n=1 Tax=Dysgonomonas sp. ZJ279 TaxID=2709796 RepID=UPI0013EE1675|nr:hypothetical protein [Dysgonomonas sp. ZJ279]
MKATNQTNPHAWFFAYLKTVDGWGQGQDDVIKTSLISEYSGKRTESLAVLYERHPKAYERMRNELSTPSLDLARKRLMAAIFKFLENQGTTGKSFDYVKAVACNAAKVTVFNNISLPTLQSLYRKFGELNAAKHEDWVNDILNNIEV